MGTRAGCHSRTNYRSKTDDSDHFSLCQDAALACKWAQRRQDRRRRHDGLWPSVITAVQVQMWYHQYGQHPAVVAALASFDDCRRQEADTFLVESLVAEEIEEQNAKGLSMSPRFVVASLIRKWRFRPRSVTTTRWLETMATDVEKQVAWRRSFRNRWNLEWGRLPDTRSLNAEEIRMRATTYIRWVRWVLNVALQEQETVVVNMDETMMANIKDQHKGIVVSRKRQRELNNQNNARRRGIPRCSLIACAANDDELQRHLPQIFLPRGKEEQQPARPLRDVFVEAGAPLEAWHGTSGFLSIPGAICFLTRLRRCIRAVRPTCRIVLLWDASMAHTNPRVLRHAKRLGIVIILIPGRMTWLLQALDAYTFVELKRHARHALLRERIRRPSGNLTMREHMLCCTEAVRQVLVNGQWAAALRKCGVSTDVAELGSNLRRVVEGADLSPQPPGSQEIQHFIGCSFARADVVKRWVVDHVTPASDAPQQQDGHEQAAVLDDTHEEGDPMLVPIMEPRGESATVGRRETAEDLHGQLLRGVPRARRLTPVVRNLRIRPGVPEPDPSRTATRSQRPRLIPGIVEVEARERGSRARSSNE